MLEGGGLGPEEPALVGRHGAPRQSAPRQCAPRQCAPRQSAPETIRPQDNVPRRQPAPGDNMPQRQSAPYVSYQLNIMILSKDDKSSSILK